jgi:hypothetical protein
MPTNTNATEPRAISDMNRNLFGEIYFTVEQEGGPVELLFPTIDAVRDFIGDLAVEYHRFDRSGA